MNNVVLSELNRKILVAIIGYGLPSVLNMQIFDTEDIKETCSRIGALEEFEVITSNSSAPA